MSNDIIIIDINENENNNNYSIIEKKGFRHIINNNKLPDIFVICTQYTDSTKANFQKMFKTFAISNNYILLEEYETPRFFSNISIQTNIYIKNDIDKSNIKNFKKDSIYIDPENSIQYLYFEYYFRKLILFNNNINDNNNKKINNFIEKYTSSLDSSNSNNNNTSISYKYNDFYNFYNLGVKHNIHRKNSNNTEYFGGSKQNRIELYDIKGYFIIFPHDKTKIASLTIININEQGNCFNEESFEKFYNSNIQNLNTDLIIVCSQNSISRKLGCDHFQTLLRQKIKNNMDKKYILKNKKNSSGLLNISQHVSIGMPSSLGIRTRVYLNKEKIFNESLLNITFKSINFTGSYGSILCSIEYNGQKIHVINSCFFDKKTLGILKRSYKNEKIDEYMKIIKEFELVKKINDNLFFVGHNIKFNLSCSTGNLTQNIIKSQKINNPNYELVNNNLNIEEEKFNISCNNTSNKNFSSKINNYQNKLSFNNKNKIPKIKLFITNYKRYIREYIKKYSIDEKNGITINGVTNKKIPLEILTISGLY
jgi:hypothetical protein